MTPTEVRASFPAEAASAGQARRFLDSTLRTWRCDHLLDAATLLVSELVANAVLHAGAGSIHVVIRIDPTRLRVEVHDGNERMPVRKHYSTMSATGRGLMLVERVSDSWGMTPTSKGKVVWFELDQSPRGGQGTSGLYDYGELDLDSIEALEDVDAGTQGESHGPGGGPVPRLRSVLTLSRRR